MGQTESTQRRDNSADGEFITVRSTVMTCKWLDDMRVACCVSLRVQEPHWMGTLRWWYVREPTTWVGGLPGVADTPLRARR
jgi:hypothetical protein